MNGAGSLVTLERKDKQSWRVTFVLTNANSILPCRRPLELLGEEKSPPGHKVPLCVIFQTTEWVSPLALQQGWGKSATQNSRATLSPTIS